MPLCLVIVWPINIKKSLARRSKRTKWSVWRNELRDIDWQIFMDETISDRKQLVENMVMRREPVQLSEGGVM